MTSHKQYLAKGTLVKSKPIKLTPAGWQLANGAMTVDKAVGNIMTRQAFGDFELHIEWRIPKVISGEGQSRGNSGVFLANTSRPPGEWQSYDVHWLAPRFHDDGSLESQARITVWYNGVLVQKDFALQGEAAFIGEPRYLAHGETPIMLQVHQDPIPPISFHNIWLRPLCVPDV